MNYCLEKHSAPDSSEIMWDSEKYPTVNTDSVYAHGQYCISGLAYRDPTNKDVAKCQTIETIDIKLNRTKGFNQYNLECNPDGTEECVYKNGK